MPPIPRFAKRAPPLVQNHDPPDTPGIRTEVACGVFFLKIGGPIISIAQTGRTAEAFLRVALRYGGVFARLRRDIKRLQIFHSLEARVRTATRATVDALVLDNQGVLTVSLAEARETALRVVFRGRV